MLSLASPCAAAMILLMAWPAMAQQQGYSVHGISPAPELERSASQRSGPEQRKLELAQTTLLNQFGGLGFSKLISFTEVYRELGAWMTAPG